MTEEEKNLAWKRIKIVFYIYFSILIFIMFFTIYNIQIKNFFKRLVGKLYIYSKTYNITNDYEPEEICSICLDNFGNKKIIKLSCSHNFHENCIYHWFHFDIRCPLCRNR